MTRFSAWLHGVVNDLRKPLNNNEYRVLGRVAVLSILGTAAIAFVAFPKWQIALIVVALAIPGSLFAGGLSILLLRRRRVAKQPSMLRGFKALLPLNNDMTGQ